MGQQIMKFLYIDNSRNFTIVSAFFWNNYQGISIVGGAIKAENSQKNSILLNSIKVYFGTIQQI